MFRRDARENEKIQYSNVLDFQGKTPVWTPACEVDFESTTSTNSITPASRCYYTAWRAEIQEKTSEKCVIPLISFAR